MDITAQSCALTIITALIFFSLRHTKIQLYTGKAYLHLLYAAFVCVSLDIASVISINSWHPSADGASQHKFFLEFICKTYLISLIFFIYWLIRYVHADLFTRKVFTKTKNLYYKYIIFVPAAFLCFTKIEYHWSDAGNVIYTFGPSVIGTYAICFVLLSCVLILLFIYKNIINPHRIKAITIWLLIWGAVSAFQFIFNGILLQAIVISLGMMILYIAVENPDSKLENEIGIYNSRTLAEYISECLKFKNEIHTITLITINMNGINEISTISKEAQTKIYEFLTNIKGVVVFSNSFGDLVLTFKNREDYKEAESIIEDRFTHGWGTYGNIVSPFFIYFGFENADYIHDFNRLRFCIKLARESIRSQTSRSLHINQDLIERYLHNLDIENTLIKAIEYDWIEVYFQPIFNTKEQKFTSAEALVRIIDDHGFMLPPYEFICIAEKNGMILKLGEIIFRKVCALLQKNIIQKLGIHYVEINLSVVQCAHRQLAKEFINIMNEYQIKPYQINLEITESASLNAKNILLDNMRILREFGVSFSLDDFGTGQSNLNYIAEMPVDLVKFDKDLTQNYFISKKTRYIMNAAISMIKGMKLKIVSEGIEDIKQYTELSPQVDYIQGYYFSKPLPQNMFIKFLEEHNHINTRSHSHGETNASYDDNNQFKHQVKRIGNSIAKNDVIYNAK